MIDRCSEPISEPPPLPCPFRIKGTHLSMWGAPFSMNSYAWDACTIKRWKWRGAKTAVDLGTERDIRGSLQLQLRIWFPGNGKVTDCAKKFHRTNLTLI